MSSAKLPQQLDWPTASIRWSTILGPIIDNPLTKGNIIKDIQLKVGVNVINHKLGRPLLGWYTTRVRSAVQLYDEQQTNAMPNLTLILVSDAIAVIDLAVF